MTGAITPDAEHGIDCYCIQCMRWYPLDDMHDVSKTTLGARGRCTACTTQRIQRGTEPA